METNTQEDRIIVRNLSISLPYLDFTVFVEDFFSDQPGRLGNLLFSDDCCGSFLRGYKIQLSDVPINGWLVTDRRRIPSSEASAHTAQAVAEKVVEIVKEYGYEEQPSDSELEPGWGWIGTQLAVDVGIDLFRTMPENLVPFVDNCRPRYDNHSMDLFPLGIVKSIASQHVGVALRKSLINVVTRVKQAAPLEYREPSCMEYCYVKQLEQLDW